MIKVFYTKQTDVANCLKEIIDKWEKGILTEEVFKKKIITVLDINKEIIYSNGQMKSIVKQRLGKKRIRLIDNITFRKE